jgi:hypothetical protein
MLSISLPVIPPTIQKFSILSISYLALLSLALFTYFSSYSHVFFRFFPVLISDSRGLISYDLSFESPVCTTLFYPHGRAFRLLWVLSSITFSCCVSFALVCRVLLITFLMCHTLACAILCIRLLLFRKKMMIENVQVWLKSSVMYALIIWVHLYHDKNHLKRKDPKAL